MLKTLWDQLNRCLYLSFEPTGHKCMNSEDEVPSAIDRVAAECGKSCDKIPCLILDFKDKSKRFADSIFEPSEKGKPSSIERFLLDHYHFNTLMIIGLRLNWCYLFPHLLLFNKVARWPRSMNVWMRDCTITLFQNFPASSQDRSKVFAPPLTSRPLTFMYSFPVFILPLQTDLTGAGDERLARLEREMDKRKLFWPFPPE